MSGTPGKSSDKPIPRERGGDDDPERKDWREPGGDVEEPPLPGTAGTEEKFPRKGEI